MITNIVADRPARDFALFYQDFGFELAWSDDELAHMGHGNSSFLLQNFYNEVHAGNFMMHLLVTNVDAWRHHAPAQGIASKCDTKTEPPEDRLWDTRDFVLVDPTGVLWRIGQNISTIRSVRALRGRTWRLDFRTARKIATWAGG
jgi:uncharacterized glyoxalase superfamily protein PhnB